MNAEDWAIVVGINEYPGLGNLNGPENDAQDFYDWLVSPDGGQVPIKTDQLRLNPATLNYPPFVPGHQLKLIKSSDFSPPFGGVDTAKPTDAEVHQAFSELATIAAFNKKQGNGYRIGRRLYLYFAGHGFAPSFEDAALLMANADDDMKLGFHISGKPWALWFFMGKVFDEVVLLMDCCRGRNHTNVGINGVKFKPLVAPEILDETKLFFGFGTKWDRKSREREFEPGKWRGVFTAALIDGLKGKAADQTTGRITARNLGNFLANNTKEYLDPSDRGNPNVEKTPALKYDPNFGDNLVFVEQTPIVGFPVSIEISPELAGRDLTITNGDTSEILSTEGKTQLDLMMPRGLYKATISNKNARFEVKAKPEQSAAAEVTNVKFV